MLFDHKPDHLVYPPGKRGDGHAGCGLAVRSIHARQCGRRHRRGAKPAAPLSSRRAGDV
jgi:hypothetical protein